MELAGREYRITYPVQGDYALFGVGWLRVHPDSLELIGRRPNRRLIEWADRIVDQRGNDGLMAYYQNDFIYGIADTFAVPIARAIAKPVNFMISKEHIKHLFQDGLTINLVYKSGNDLQTIRFNARNHDDLLAICSQVEVVLQDIDYG